MNRVSKIAWVIAPDHDVPGLHIAIGITKRRERDAVLGAPSAGINFRRRVVEKVGRKIFVAVPIVKNGVALNAARIHAQLHRSALVVARVDKDSDVVVRADDVVPLDIGRANLARIGVFAAHADVEIVIVIGEIDDRLHFRLNVVAGLRLVELVDRCCVFPTGIGQVAIDANGALRSPNRDRRRSRRCLGDCGGRHKE